MISSDFTSREAAAISLVDRLVIDPHSVDDTTFAVLRRHFSDEEIIELVCASSLFTWAGALNTVVRLDTDRMNLAYATAPAAAWITGAPPWLDLVCFEGEDCAIDSSQK
jgi:hypothetical protein